MKIVLVDIAAFVLAFTATAAIVGGNAVLARHQFAAAERIARTPTAAPQTVIVVARRSQRA